MCTCDDGVNFIAMYVYMYNIAVQLDMCMIEYCIIHVGEHDVMWLCSQSDQDMMQYNQQVTPPREQGT